ncbi:MAG: CoA transferase subunit A [Bacteroidales bacterium]|nr:CoA transferase subunit A [Bacteroidales bacterium]
MKKVISAQEAAAMVKDGMTIMIGGFLAAGSALKVIEAIAEGPAKDLTIICNDAGYPDRGSGRLIAAGKVKKLIASHIGTNPLAVEGLNNKTLEIEFVPQGSLAEKVRAGGAGLGGVLTPTGLGTIIAEGKEVVTVDGKEFLLEKPLHADLALLGASKSDADGNLIYRGTTNNFNPMMATAADLVIAEAKEIVPVGEILPEHVHTPALFVDYLVQA